MTDGSGFETRTVNPSDHLLEGREFCLLADLEALLHALCPRQINTHLGTSHVYIVQFATHALEESSSEAAVSLDLAQLAKSQLIFSRTTCVHHLTTKILRWVVLLELFYDWSTGNLRPFVLTDYRKTILKPI